MEKGLGGAFVVGHLRGAEFFHFPIEEAVKKSAATISTENMLDGVATINATKKDIHIKPDHRTTLYWNPEIIVENGSATFSFYTADNNSVYNIRLEGITTTGIPVFGEHTFEVKE